MNDAPRPSTQAGGCLLAFAVMAGALLGAIYREPSLGAVIGAAIGIALALLVWLVDRRRR